ncbi:hypothetical protein TEA_000295 [Camellia sinensis var. sinensis]|uniref:Uncharacterized protein n=1 Tax=Camellia sinensis var. sinensis TaxID=542762 RepID=A0A4S4EYV1_CAMSN|nr:hypothetical protein TEA_000295 [Camellia sinensis var. sinensis]
MAATRLISLHSSSRPLGLGLSSFSSSSSITGLKKLNNLALSSTTTVMIRCVCEEEKQWLSKKKKQSVVVVKASVAASESSNVLKTSKPPHQTNAGEIGMASLLAKVAFTALLVLRVVTKPRPWKLHPQMLIERGCFMVLESYFHYFNSLSQSSDHGDVMHLLIEAIDMFLIGTAMLIFGMGLHAMFVGSKYLKGKGSQLPSSNFFGLFHLKTLPRWVGMKSVTEAKSKIGQAVMMTLQVGVLEKFKSIPLVTGFDLACFAGAVFVIIDHRSSVSHRTSQLCLSSQGHRSSVSLFARSSKQLFSQLYLSLRKVIIEVARLTCWFWFWFNRNPKKLPSLVPGSFGDLGWVSR